MSELVFPLLVRKFSDSLPDKIVVEEMVKLIISSNDQEILETTLEILFERYKERAFHSDDKTIPDALFHLSKSSISVVLKKGLLSRVVDLFVDLSYSIFESHKENDNLPFHKILPLLRLLPCISSLSSFLFRYKNHFFKEEQNLFVQSEKSSLQNKDGTPLSSISSSSSLDVIASINETVQVLSPQEEKENLDDFQQPPPSDSPPKQLSSQQIASNKEKHQKEEKREAFEKKRWWTFWNFCVLFDLVDEKYSDEKWREKPEIAESSKHIEEIVSLIPVFVLEEQQFYEVMMRELSTLLNKNLNAYFMQKVRVLFSKNAIDHLPLTKSFNDPQILYVASVYYLEIKRAKMGIIYPLFHYLENKSLLSSPLNSILLLISSEVLSKYANYLVFKIDSLSFSKQHQYQLEYQLFLLLLHSTHRDANIRKIYEKIVKRLASIPYLLPFLWYFFLFLLNRFFLYSFYLLFFFGFYLSFFFWFFLICFIFFMSYLFYFFYVLSVSFFLFYFLFFF